MSRDVWNKFLRTISVRYVLSYLCGTLYLDPSASIKRIFALSVWGLFSLSTHALTCLSIKSIVTDCYGTCYVSGGLEVFYCVGLEWLNVLLSLIKDNLPVSFP